MNNVVQTKENSTEVDDDEFYDIYSLSMSRNPALVVEAKINGTDVTMEVDTGASKSIIKWKHIIQQNVNQIHLHIPTVN